MLEKFWRPVTPKIVRDFIYPYLLRFCFTVAGDLFSWCAPRYFSVGYHISAYRARAHSWVFPKHEQAAPRSTDETMLVQQYAGDGAEAMTAKLLGA